MARDTVRIDLDVEVADRRRGLLNPRKIGAVAAAGDDVAGEFAGPQYRLGQLATLAAGGFLREVKAERYRAILNGLGKAAVPVELGPEAADLLEGGGVVRQRTALEFDRAP